MGETVANIGLIITYILFAVIIIAWVGTETLALVRNPKSARKSFINAGILGAVFLICWGISSDSLILPLYEKMEITPSVSKLVGGGLIMFYILFMGAVVSALFVEVSSLFKR